jgi:hypothetical protein
MFQRLRIATVLLIAAGAIGAAEPRGKLYRGHLVIAPEVEVFRPCGSKKPLWLDYSSEMRAPMFRRYMELRKEPYEETYAVLRGTLGPRLDCGFCEHFQGSFKVLEVIEQRRDGPANCR